MGKSNSATTRYRISPKCLYRFKRGGQRHYADDLYSAEFHSSDAKLKDLARVIEEFPDLETLGSILDPRCLKRIVSGANL